jgi:hypothetical protein
LLRRDSKMHPSLSLIKSFKTCKVQYKIYSGLNANQAYSCKTFFSIFNTKKWGHQISAGKLLENLPNLT